MSQIDETKEKLVEQVTGLLTGKPIWVWWISYTVLAGLLFGLFYFVWSILTEKWWGIAIVILCAGIAWGTVLYFNKKPSSGNPSSEE